MMIYALKLLVLLASAAAIMHLDAATNSSLPNTGAPVTWANLSIFAPEDGRYLYRTSSGKPFFWQADTAWELFHRLNPSDIDFYLRDRASKGFTVIQAVAIPELNGTTFPKFYGDLPLVDRDPLQLNDAYFKHIDWQCGELRNMVSSWPWCPLEACMSTAGGTMRPSSYSTKRMRSGTAAGSGSATLAFPKSLAPTRKASGPVTSPVHKRHGRTTLRWTRRLLLVRSKTHGLPGQSLRMGCEPLRRKRALSLSSPGTQQTREKRARSIPWV